MALSVEERRALLAKKQQSGDKKERTKIKGRLGITLDADDISFPDEKSIPENDLSKVAFMIYGEAGIGKTSLSAQFPNSLIVAFEKGYKALPVYAIDSPDWVTALKIKQKLTTEQHKFKNIVIDTANIAYKRCSEDFCINNEISHIQDFGYGKGYDMVYSEFSRFFSDIYLNDMGVIAIAHSKIVEEKYENGTTDHKTVPDLTGQALTFFKESIDVCIYCRYIKDKRYMQLQHTQFVYAKNRFSDVAFRTQDGERIYFIPMGESSEEAYNNLMRAFNNKQKKTYKELLPQKEKVVVE